MSEQDLRDSLRIKGAKLRGCGLDPTPTTREDRIHDARAQIIALGLECVILGRGPAGQVETYGQAFERVYGQPIQTTTTGKKRK